jgi:hypothetical protein
VRLSQGRAKISEATKNACSFPGRIESWMSGDRTKGVLSNSRRCEEKRPPHLPCWVNLMRDMFMHEKGFGEKHEDRGAEERK